MIAELKVVELENKKGVAYSTLEIYVLNQKTGENLKVASLYLQDTLKTLLLLLDEQNKTIAK
jgi:hypothetical protein